MPQLTVLVEKSSVPPHPILPACVQRLTGSLEHGCELVATLTALCLKRGLRDVTWRVAGVVDEVELSAVMAASGAPGPTRRYGSHFGLVHCEGRLVERDGRIEARAECVLSREGESGIEVVGGRLLRARVQSVDFVIEYATDEVPATTIAVPAVAPVVSTPPAPTWADVARSSAAHESPSAGEPLYAAVEEDDEGEDDARDDTSLEEEPLQRGDVLVHPRFGACGVERIEGANEYAQVRLANQRLVRLSLEVLRLTRDGSDEQGRRRFRAVIDV